MAAKIAPYGKPVFIEPLSERLPATRFKRFQDSFRRDGITRPFEGRLEHWTYIPPDDAARVGRIIRQELGLAPVGTPRLREPHVPAGADLQSGPLHGRP